MQPRLQRLTWQYLSTSWPTLSPPSQAAYTAAAGSFQYPDIRNVLVTLTPEQLYRYLGEQAAINEWGYWQGSGFPPASPLVAISAGDGGPRPAPVVTNIHLHADATFSFDITDASLPFISTFAVYITNPFRRKHDPTALLHVDNAVRVNPPSSPFAAFQQLISPVGWMALPVGKPCLFGVRHLVTLYLAIPPPTQFTSSALFSQMVKVEP